MFLLLFLLPSVTALCPDTATCISRVKEIVAAPRRFWFGEQRRAQCQHRQANPIDCFGPSHLAVYHSLGSRLFRAKTYHTAYLRNLEIFPRITYRALPGHYRACDHEFHVGNVSANVVEADPDMSSVEPFLIRKKPEIGWHGLRFDEEFTILMTDVGFGTLNYLVTNFPIKPKVLKEYETSENFRPVDNPLVLLVFRKGKKDVEVPDAENFDLTTFMLKNDLADNLVGLSLVVVGSDAFAIERQRLRGTVDNCHSLIRKKVVLSASTPLISHLPLDELRAWLTISFEQPRVNARICCQKIRQSASTIFLDPLGDLSISALSTLTPPSVTSMRTPVGGTTYVNYHRQARTYVALMDDLFSIVLIDSSNSALHWLVVDIPASELSYGARGITKASYLPLVPSKPASCSSFVFLLFTQSGSLKQISNCDENCQKKEFKVDHFKQRHSLRLTAISWVTSCYDLSYSFYILQRSQAETRRISADQIKNSSSPTVSMLSANICSAFNVSPQQKCTISAANLGLSIISFIFLALITFGHCSSECVYE